MSFFRPPMESKNVKSLLKKKGFVYLCYFTLMVEVDYVAKWKLYGISYIRVVFGIKERNIVNEN